MSISVRTCALFIALFGTTLVMAQQPLPQAPSMGTITGTVLDVSGAVVPTATVLLQGPAPADQRKTVAGDTGFFKFEGIQPRTPYRILISAPGLKDWSSNEIVLQPAQWLTLADIALAVAPVATSVDAVTVEQLAAEQVKAAESQRVLGFIPNFYVAYDHDAVPLPSKLKFQLAFRTMVDPVTIAGFGLGAALYQISDYPSYSQGAKGYGQRLGATFAGGYTNILVGNALLPSLLHQDPRYFYQGTGTTKSRLWHALSNGFVTKGDNGHDQFNFSSIGGDLASGAIANAYYPDRDRGSALVVRSALIGAGGRMLNGVVQEFVLRKFTSKHSSQEP